MVTKTSKKTLEYIKRWAKEHPELRRKYSRTWIIKNREYMKSKREKLWFNGEKQNILKRDNYRCTRCGITNDEHKKKYNSELLVHHIDNRGRATEKKNNQPNNLKTYCRSCHCIIHNPRLGTGRQTGG